MDSCIISKLNQSEVGRKKLDAIMPYKAMAAMKAKSSEGGEKLPKVAPGHRRRSSLVVALKESGIFRAYVGSAFRAGEPGRRRSSLAELDRTVGKGSEQIASLANKAIRRMSQAIGSKDESPITEAKSLSTPHSKGKAARQKSPGIASPRTAKRSTFTV